MHYPLGDAGAVSREDGGFRASRAKVDRNDGHRHGSLSDCRGQAAEAIASRPPGSASHSLTRSTATLVLMPKRVTPRSNIAAIVSRLLIPPDALTWTAPWTVSTMSRSLSSVVPNVQPVPVLTKA